MSKFFKTQGQEFLDVANLLFSKEYNELPAMVVDDADEQEPIVLIDKENKNYLLVCTEGMKRMEEFITKCLKKEVEIITLNQVQLWEN